MVVVPGTWLLLLNTKILVHGFQGFFKFLSFWCWFGVIFKYYFVSVPNQVEPEALVLEPKLTGTLTAQNFRYQNTEVAVLSVLLFLAQNYFLSFSRMYR